MMRDQPYFSDEALEWIESQSLLVHEKTLKLMDAYLRQEFNDVRAKEFAINGFPRRLKTLSRCIENTFDLLPPDGTAQPTSEQLVDAAINIQAFVFNVYGSADNLAWIWVCEKDLREGGKPLPKLKIGLGKKCEAVRNSFSQAFQEYLEGKSAWFDQLEDFRHALAHRIPLYIPPYVLPAENESNYHEITGRMAIAVKRHDFDEYDRLLVEQESLGVFTPWMTHSFEEKAEHVAFHVRMLEDFNVIEELGQNMLSELTQLRA